MRCVLNRSSRPCLLALAGLIAGCSSGSGHTPSPINTYVVQGTADIWLAGQANGSELPSTVIANPDVAPTNSPLLVPVAAASTLTFSVTGATANFKTTTCTGATPDGAFCNSANVTDNNGPAEGVSSVSAPFNSLVGVFLDDGVPGTAASVPQGLDFTNNTNFATLSPILRQVFFIGDGLTGTGTGSVQRFLVPPGATRLFLASCDNAGASNDNAGQFTVVVSSE